MKYYVNHKRILVTVSIFAVLFFNISSKDLLKSRKTSYLTYVYKITDNEAAVIYKKGFGKCDSSFFHTLTDTYPTDSAYNRRLPTGHYLKTYIKENKQFVSYFHVPAVVVEVLNNNTDLCIRVYDLAGNVIENADVYLNNKELNLDKETRCYTLKKTNRKGLLKVEYMGNVMCYDLKRSRNYPGVLRVYENAFYTKPLVYLTLPISYMVHLPIDGVKSIIYGRATGTISTTKVFVNNLFGQKDRLRYPMYKGYMVLNKPKFLTGDTVKIKAFIVDFKGKPLNKNVFLSVDNDDNTPIARIHPYRPGAFAYNFCLTDSLKLKLDHQYFLELNDGDEIHYISTKFYYEDYDLNGVKLYLRYLSDKQYSGQKFPVFLNALDENNLKVQDARVEMVVKNENINEVFENSSYVPDTIWSHNFTLIAKGETEIVIPDTVFPHCNMTYKLITKLFTIDNKCDSVIRIFNYNYRKEGFVFQLDDDSIRISYSRNNEEQARKTKISVMDNFENQTELGEFTTPCVLPVQPFYQQYIAQSDSRKERIFMPSEPSLIGCNSIRTADSLIVSVANPRKLNFVYNIYCENKEIAKGAGDHLDFKLKTSTKRNYFISLRYLWGGKVESNTYKIPFNDKSLKINVEQPHVIYPGQKVRTSITVTDQYDKPVEGVDLTAFSLTKKLNYVSPDMPYLGKIMPGKKFINNFGIDNNPHFSDIHHNINYRVWKTFAGLDSIEYYRFLFPGNEIYRYEKKMFSDNDTQFAPFVVSSNGEVQPVMVIYVDHVPLYFNWSTNNEPYSFKVDSGFHNVMLRLRNRLITMNRVWFRPGYKIIFSVPEELSNADVQNRKMPPNLYDYEARVLKPYVFPYRKPDVNKFMYLQSGDNIRLLSPVSQSYGYREFAGPVVGSVQLKSMNDFSLSFQCEPGFEYDFYPELLKMRNLSDNEYPTKWTLYSRKTCQESLNDSVWNKKGIESEFSRFADEMRRHKARYTYPKMTTNGFGCLNLIFDNESNTVKHMLLNILIFKISDDKFLRIYPDDQFKFHQLTEGYYNVTFFYSGSYYFSLDSIYVKPNGNTFIKTHVPPVLKKDSFSIKVNDLIEKNLYSNSNQNKLAENQILNQFASSVKYTGEGIVVNGKVFDNDTKEPIIGALIKIPGTRFGSVTNLNGQFSINVPFETENLNITYIGYKPQVISLMNPILDVGLVSDYNALDEVVVVGYGVAKRSLLTGSVTQVPASLAGQAPGINTSTTGKRIDIRGVIVSAHTTGQPLVIVDGMVYSGNIDGLDPALIESIELVKNDEAMTVYGSRATNGVVLITTKGNKKQRTEALGAENDVSGFLFPDDLSNGEQIRKNFSDEAYWQPRLTTDQYGKATFETSFPDDITNWQTVVLAANDQRQTGKSGGNIKSFKPVSAQLSVPAFLIENDSCNVIGKTVNYLPDSVPVITRFEFNKKIIDCQPRMCNRSLVDFYPVIANNINDTSVVKYLVSRQDRPYSDGEERLIEIRPAGIEEVSGNFYVMPADSAIEPPLDTSKGEVTLYAGLNCSSVFEKDIDRLIRYKYNCNEQVASRLIALLSEKILCSYQNRAFSHEREIRKQIKMLIKNQIKPGLWGWFPGLDVHYVFSSHVIDALEMAKNEGYSFDLNIGKLSMVYAYELEKMSPSEVKNGISILKMSKLIGCNLDYKKYIQKLDILNDLSLEDKLEIIELKQLCGLPYDLTILNELKKRTLLGNVFFSSSDKETSYCKQRLLINALAYRLMRNRNVNDSVLPKIRAYFIESKSYSNWNTYETAQILKTVIPDLKDDSTSGSTVLLISGDVTRTVDKFPFELKIPGNEKIRISKRGKGIVYLSVSQKSLNKNPTSKKGDFEISTGFNTARSVLEAGKSVTLNVKVVIRKDAEFVQIRIPIPAGCSYDKKPQPANCNDHREYLKNETNIYCQVLKAGIYNFDISLLPRFTGKYTLNAAQVSQMYFPLFNANNEMKQICIERDVDEEK